MTAVPSAILAAAFCWLVFGWGTARISGWHRLASIFRGGTVKDVAVARQTRNFQTIGVGSIQYYGIVRISCSKHVVSISLTLPLVAGHTAIAVPWKSASTEFVDGFTRMDVDCGDRRVLLVLPGWVTTAVEQ